MKEKEEEGEEKKKKEEEKKYNDIKYGPILISDIGISLGRKGPAVSKENWGVIYPT